MSQRFDYKYSVDQCDVIDKERCEQYRQKRRQWAEWLAGDDPHAIIKQLYSVLWDYALFCTINELRRLAAEKPQKGIGFNGPVMRLFDAGFATTQATTIRRLIEWPSQRPGRAVISIRTVLKDMRENVALVTRENYVCHDGLPYDYRVIHNAAFSKLPIHQSKVSVGVMPTNGPEGWPMSERAHKNFDKLAQIDSSRRTRIDLINVDIFDNLESQIQACENVKKYVDKFIAHGAAPQTRESLAEDERGITLERIETCHETIYRVASFIFGNLIWESNIGGVPVPQFDHLKGLDNKWATKGRLDKARAKWDEINKKVSEWDSSQVWPDGVK
jgi:hypothetical protein